MISKGFIALCAAATMLASPALAANLVVNGDFEANAGDGSVFVWNVAGDGILGDTVFPNGGSHSAAFTSLNGDPNPGVLFQDLTTVGGQDYRLAFSLLNLGAFGLFDIFNVSFGGFSTSISGLDVSASLTGGAYTPFVFDIRGGLITDARTALSFSSLSDGTFGGPFYLDDVSVEAVAVPEPSQWLLMISGFALAGAALRRRHRALAV